MSKWSICCNCDGDGSHSKHLGVINTEEWDDESLKAYFNGAYDMQCEVCEGTGKVLTNSNRVNKYYSDDREYFRQLESY